MDSSLLDFTEQNTKVNTFIHHLCTLKNKTQNQKHLFIAVLIKGAKHRIKNTYSPLLCLSKAFNYCKRLKTIQFTPNDCLRVIDGFDFSLIGSRKIPISVEIIKGFEHTSISHLLLGKEE
jgi:hypothetical protein